MLPPDAASAGDRRGWRALRRPAAAIWADHDRLEQVFVNLLGNALGHNPPGTKVLVTAVSAAAGRTGPAR